jgi:hypothetical protein
MEHLTDAIEGLPDSPVIDDGREGGYFINWEVANYSTHGKYCRATLWDPEEYPEIEIATVKGTVEYPEALAGKEIEMSFSDWSDLPGVTQKDIDALHEQAAERDADRDDGDY